MKLVEKTAQFILNFEAGIVESYHSCREYIGARVHQQPGKPHGLIAQMMDLSPSKLTRKLGQSDTSRFTLDDFEAYLQVTGDTKPLAYLVEKHMANANKDELRRQIAALQSQLERKK